jgi:hypothetical protein
MVKFANAILITFAGISEDGAAASNVTIVTLYYLMATHKHARRDALQKIKRP